MSLKVIRYKNYGCAMSSIPEDNGVITHNFYWCFFELSNGKTLSVHLTDNWDKEEKYLGQGIECSTTSCYEFGEEFYDWFDKTFEFLEEERKLSDPTEEEERLVLDFYRRGLEETKDVVTDIVNL